MNDTDKLVYLDNGATSFPKPSAVAKAMGRFVEKTGGSPGRAGHRLSQEAARIVFSCRESIATLFGIPDSKQIVFTLNATEALNIALLGLLKPGDRVVTTSMEHNSVMRPLRHLARTAGILLDIVPSDSTGRIDLEKLKKALSRRPRLLAATHASNVTGAMLPLRTVGELTVESGTLFLLDAAQTGGSAPVEVETDGVDLLAFTGHKSLLGPQGTGGLWVRDGLDVEPVYRGGTGSNSEFEEQPSFYPDRLECGTQNAVGLAGLNAGVGFILETGIDAIGAREKALTCRLMEGLSSIPGVVLYGPGADEERMPVVSLAIKGMVPSEIGFLLDEAFGILTRTGLHCAPSAHQSIGTFPHGTVRMCPGFFTTEDDIDAAIEACRYIAGKKG